MVERNIDFFSRVCMHCMYFWVLCIVCAVDLWPLIHTHTLTGVFSSGCSLIIWIYFPIVPTISPFLSPLVFFNYLLSALSNEKEINLYVMFCLYFNFYFYLKFLRTYNTRVTVKRGYDFI